MCRLTSPHVALPAGALCCLNVICRVWVLIVTLKLSGGAIKTHYSLQLGCSANGLMRCNYGLDFLKKKSHLSLVRSLTYRLTLH